MSWSDGWMDVTPTVNVDGFKEVVILTETTT